MNESIAKKHEQFESELYKQPDEFIEKADTSDVEHKNPHLDKLETVRKNVELYSASKDTIKIQGRENKNTPTVSSHISKQIKNETYAATLSHAQSRLKPTERLFSKVIHKPVIENISEVSSKTIARPSGILSGAIFSLIGVSIVTIIARHIGFTVPSLIFAALFLIGFVMGILTEAFCRSLKKLLKN